MQLRDNELLLRPWNEGDIPALARACDDSDTARFIPQIPSPYTEDDARTWIGLCRDLWQTGDRLPFAIVHAENAELLGSIDVRLGEVGSIGYWVAPWARGRGIATAALVLLSRWAIRERGVERLELTTHPENIASQRVAEKAGFVREGVLRSHIRFREGRRDSVLFSLLPADLL
jgi:RimJ/RimL family protein N-acetyltransferase